MLLQKNTLASQKHTFYENLPQEDPIFNFFSIDLKIVPNRACHVPGHVILKSYMATLCEGLGAMAA